jgi:nitrogen regulatory protein PII
MKMVFIIQCEHYNKRVMQLLDAVGIDYYTRWDQAQGKGHGTEPHLGRGTYASTNSVMMIAFQDEAPLEALIQAITAANSEIKRAADRIRLFQLPLERMV